MTEEAAESGVVAGDDGSEGARAAVEWAAAEAAARDTCLVVVRTVPLAVPTLSFVPGTIAPSAAELAEEQSFVDYAERELATVAAAITRRRPDVPVRTRVELGRASDELARVGERAELIVVGASGKRALPRLLLGSTAAQLVHSSTRPVVVVRPVKSPRKRVVVGVDGSPASSAAVRFAYDFADRHGCDLHAVHAWADPIGDFLEPVNAGDEGWPTVREEGERLLAESLTGLAELHPDVVVTREIGLGRAAQVLLDNAEGATLLVVGGHGRGALRGMFLGSVSHAMAYHSPCPVAIVREGTEEHP
ncbi:universal stress protein [Amycolatopsis jejuensis]|uniref:universal stress protein n=1 Tax=Amycolatopsis jejuensis TaxID=330084 RepID=UPI000525D541|nr:universal stress protein [Amycolatopsis jejuensis]